ncbi:MAG: toll/interleukin-1 receptor domain-containing protein [Allosphingosinicella sp.]
MQIQPAPLSPTDPADSGPAAKHPPRVFISYSHDSAEHADRVLELADRLRRDGIEATIDQYVASPSEGWPRWMDRQIDESDFVLLVCTQTYYRRVMGQEEPGKGLGVRWEGMLVYQHIFDSAAFNTRFVPILFKPWATEYIPRPVKGASHYFVDAEDGYEGLHRRLTAQPKTAPPPVSPMLRQWRRDPDQAARFGEVRGLGSVVVQAAGDGRAVVDGLPHLTLARRHGRRRPIRSDLDLLNPFSRAIPLIGREAEMAGSRHGSQARRRLPPGVSSAAPARERRGSRSSCASGRRRASGTPASSIRANWRAFTVSRISPSGGGGRRRSQSSTAPPPPRGCCGNG